MGSLPQARENIEEHRRAVARLGKPKSLPHIRKAGDFVG